MKIGVLALQGAFDLHRPHLEALGVQVQEVVTPRDFEGIAGLILPGGESGVLLKLIEMVGIDESLKAHFASKAAWGICAGAILMAKDVQPVQKSYSAIDIAVERNAYGRQLESTQQSVNGYSVSYIRAPRISRVGAGVQVLHERTPADPSWVRCGNKMVTTFHPETNWSRPSPWHQKFLELCK